MDYINEVKALIPDYAKDVRINLDGVLGRSSLPANEAAAVALAAAYAAQGPTTGRNHSQLGRSYPTLKKTRR